MMTNKNIVIAIDGPAGAGKSTVAKLLAKKLGFVYIDTGAMYRAIAYKFRNLNVDLDNENEVEQILKETKVEYVKGNLYLDYELLTDEIRSPEVNELVSPVAAIPVVREYMTEAQRKIGKIQNSILDGRDVGTAIFPNADVKIFLIANTKKRAMRRQLENISKGIESTFEEIEANINLRDKIDSERDVAPLVKAADAVEIDTSEINPDEVVAKILSIYQEKINV